MKQFLIGLIAVVMLASVPSSPRAEQAGEIQGVISGQIAAFQANDLNAAFGFASPSIQQIFRSPDQFGRMVKQGYPMVWRPARFEMMDILMTERGPVQLVMFEDQSGRLHEAGYLMQEVNGQWRINGVHVREMPGVGA